MKLTALDLAVIVDTLNGSLSIKGGDLFNYTEEARKTVIGRIIGIMKQSFIELNDIDDE
jgi:predicted ABC-type transport system involved in lysophospholipase L1 biosynthesis ATPase subunit